MCLFRMTINAVFQQNCLIEPFEKVDIWSQSLQNTEIPIELKILLFVIPATEPVSLISIPTK